MYFCCVKTITEHIEVLLARHDYVVVPGFGGFVLQFQHATVHENYIAPPCQTISFNPLMNQSDGLLAIEISRSRGISYRQATDLINSEVTDFLSGLNNGHTVEFGRMGWFEKSASATLVFTPVNFASFLPSNTGLDNVYLQRNDKRKDTVVIRFNRQKFLRYAAAIALLIGLLLVSPQLNDVRINQQAGLLPQHLETVVTPVQTTTADTLTEVQPCPELKTDTIQNEVKVTNNAELYHVVVASLATEKCAEGFCQELIADGFDCAHVLEPHKTYRVSIKSFTDRDEAIQYMEELRRTDERFAEAWVLCR